LSVFALHTSGKKENICLISVCQAVDCGLENSQLGITAFDEEVSQQGDDSGVERGRDAELMIYMLPKALGA
jgi:hypothetical protein